MSYILANPTTDATVYAVRKISGEWRFMDASYDQGIARQDYREKSGVDEDDYNWYEPYTTLNTSSKVYRLSEFKSRTTNKKLDGKIYFAEDVNYRLDYLKKVVELAGNIIYDLNPDAKIGLVTFAGKAQSKGWFGENQFAYTGNANDPNLLDKVDAISPEAKTNQYDGLVKAKAAFSENAVKESKYKVAILITDGAPNGKTDPDNSNSPDVTWGNETTVNTIRYAANQLKQSGVTLYTVGLSVGNVTGAEDGLKHSATNESFYKAPEDGEQLLRDVESILLSLMQKATVTGNVSDVIDPTFYPVTMSGEPVSEGIYNVDTGQKVGELTALNTWTAGNTPFYTWTKTSDGNGNEVWKVTWYKQELAWKGNDTDPSPWKKTIFVKAKEDYMGGNGVSTNGDGSQVDATGWKAIFKGETKTGSLSVTKPFATPYVNVDELGLSGNSTEWTVYLGTNVDPESELRALWNKIEVQQVVKSGGTQDDGTRITQNTKMYYTSFPNAQNGTVEERTADKDYPSDNTNAIIPLSDNRYIPSSVFEQLLSQLKEDTDAISRVETSCSYAPFGTKVGEFMITIDRAVNTEAAEDSAPEAHDTKKTGEAVETYKISIGYMALPSGVENWNTGDHITESPGKAPDSVHSTNTHVINVFSKKLQIEKKDKDTDSLITDKSAVFTLYKSTNGSVPSKADDIVAENGTVASGYAAVGTLTTKTTATATADVPAGKTEAYDFVPLHFGMFNNEADKTTTYYLVETTQPEGYIKSTEVWPVTLTISESPTGAAGAATVASGNPYDWTQTATLTVGTQTSANDSNTATVIFSVENERGVDIEILKVDDNNEPLDLATFRLQKKEGTYQDIKSIKVSAGSEDLKYPYVGGLDGNSSFVSGTEKVTITKLPDGDYKLVEDSTHDGYIIKQKEIEFTITGGVISGTNIEGIVTFKEAEGTVLALITVINEPGAALPNTGGPGTRLIYLLGIMLTSLAGAGLVMRWRRNAA